MQGNKFLYNPDLEALETSNASEIIKKYNLSDFNSLYNWSVDPETGKDFYLEIFKRLNLKFKDNFSLSRNNLIDSKNPKYPLWFVGANLNIADSLLKASSDKIAIKYQSGLCDNITEITYRDLDNLSNKIANGLKNKGYKKGDYIAINMPMNIEATAIYLAIAKIGGIVVCLADSYSIEDTDKRLAALDKPVKAIFTQDYGRTKKQYEIYEKILNCKNLPKHAIINQIKPEESSPNLRGCDDNFSNFIKGQDKVFESVSLKADDNITILFSSGTTGDPKAIPWKFDSFVKSAMDAHINFDMKPKSTLCWLTDYGWMMGSFVLAASFLNDGTLAIYEGNRSTTHACDFIEKSQVNILGIVPAIAEAWQRSKVLEKFKWDNLNLICSTGNPSSPANYTYLSNVIGKKPILEYMGGTEISGGYITGCLHKPLNPSMFNSFCCGTKTHIFEEDTENFKENEVAIIIPSPQNGIPPIGISRALVNKNFTHTEKYYNDCYIFENGDIARKHGDLLSVKENGLIKSEGRCDGAININGIKTTIAELENAITEHQNNISGLKNFAVIGARPKEGGEDKIIIFAEAETNFKFNSTKFKIGFKNAIKNLNPQLAKISEVIECKIPLTASGKKQYKRLQNLYYSK